MGATWRALFTLVRKSKGWVQARKDWAACYRDSLPFHPGTALMHRHRLGRQQPGAVHIWRRNLSKPAEGSKADGIDLQFSIPPRGSLSGGQPCENRLLGSGRRDRSVCHNEMKLVRLGVGRADHVPAAAGAAALATAGQLQPEPAAH